MNSRASKPKDGVASIRSLVVLSFAMLLIPVLLFAAPPPWWRDLQATNGNPPNDYAPVNQGQVKKLVKETVAELDAYLPGGAGDTLHDLVASWAIPTAQTNDYAPVNNGQLKALAKPVYDRLLALGYRSQYPWGGSSAPANDYAMANIGQAKQLFNLNFTALQPPTGLTATPSNPGEMDLNWTNNDSNATSVTINESTDGGVTWTQVATLTNPALNSYAVTGLTQGVNYTFSVTANSASGSSSASTTGNSGTVTQSVPTTPTDFMGTLDSSGHMNLTWTASQGTVEYYKIEREDLSTGTWSTLTTLSATSYSDTSRQPSGGYHYRVSAVNALGPSVISSEFPISRYAVIDLGAIHPQIINNKGDVVGGGTNALGSDFVTNIVFWHAGSLTTVPLPQQPVHSYSPPAENPEYIYASISGLNDSGTMMGKIDYGWDIPPQNPSDTHGLDIRDQIVEWDNTQTATNQPPIYTPTVMVTSDFPDIVGPSSSGGYALGEMLNFQYFTDPGASPFSVGFDPNIDKIFPQGIAGGGWQDNTFGWFSANSSTPECMNRLGDMAGDSRQEVTVTNDPSGVSFSNYVTKHVFWKYGSSNGADRVPVELPFSWYVTSLTDSIPPTYVGVDEAPSTTNLGHIYDPTQTTPDITIGPYTPCSISTPTDPNQMQMIANTSYQSVNGQVNNMYPFLFEKQIVPPSTQATWMTTPYNVNDLIGSVTGFTINSVSSLNNDGAIVGSATKTSDSTYHGVMLLPLQITTLGPDQKEEVIGASIPACHPQPIFTNVAVTSITVSSDGVVTASVTGQVKDSVESMVDKSQPFSQTVNFDVDAVGHTDQDGTTIDLGSTGVTAVPMADDPKWKPYGSELFSFSKQVTFSATDAGRYEMGISYTNRLGYRGECTVAVTLGTDVSILNGGSCNLHLSTLDATHSTLSGTLTVNSGGPPPDGTSFSLNQSATGTYSLVGSTSPWNVTVDASNLVTAETTFTSGTVSATFEQNGVSQQRMGDFTQSDSDPNSFSGHLQDVNLAPNGLFLQDYQIEVDDSDIGPDFKPILFCFQKGMHSMLKGLVINGTEYALDTVGDVDLPVDSNHKALVLLFSKNLGTSSTPSNVLDLNQFDITFDFK